MVTVRLNWHAAEGYWETKGSSVSSVHSVISNSLWPHGLEHASLPSPSPTPGSCSNLCPSSWWFHPTISFSIVSFASCLQSFPASGSFPMSQFFSPGGQRIGASASASAEGLLTSSLRLSMRVRVSLSLQRGEGLFAKTKISCRPSPWSTHRVQFSSVQFSHSVVSFATPWTAAHQAYLFITNSQSLLKLMSIESEMPSNHLILCCPLFLLPSIFPSIRVFSNESALHIRWPKYWIFSFSISLSNEYSGLLSFKMQLLDLFAVQGTLKSLLQHHSSKASILWCSTFFTVQLSHLYMTTGKLSLWLDGPLLAK